MEKHKKPSKEKLEDKKTLRNMVQFESVAFAADSTIRLLGCCSLLFFIMYASDIDLVR